MVFKAWEILKDLKLMACSRSRSQSKTSICFRHWTMGTLTGLGTKEIHRNLVASLLHLIWQLRGVNPICWVIETSMREVDQDPKIIRGWNLHWFKLMRMTKASCSAHWKYRIRSKPFWKEKDYSTYKIKLTWGSKVDKHLLVISTRFSQISWTNKRLMSKFSTTIKLLNNKREEIENPQLELYSNREHSKIFFLSKIP